MAYTGAVNIGELGGTGNGTDRQDLFKELYVETLEAYTRSNIGEGLISVMSIPSGKAGEFIVGEYADGTDHTTHVSGSQISVTDQAFDKRLINIDDLEYVAKRIDSFEEMMAHYPSRTVVTNYMGETMAKFVDRKIFTTVEGAATATGLVSNPVASNVVNAAIASGATSAAKGNAIAESIIEAQAALEVVDNMNPAVCVLDPINYSYLLQSDRMVSKDFTDGNGGLDTGKVGMVGGVAIYKSNNLPTTANLEGLVFTKEAAGMLKLQDLKSEVNYQPDFFADLLSVRLGVGYGTLRPECAVTIKSA